MSKTGSTRHVLRATMALLGVLRARPWEVPREALPLPLAGARSRRINMSSQEGGEGGRPKVIVISGKPAYGRSFPCLLVSDCVLLVVQGPLVWASRLWRCGCARD